MPTPIGQQTREEAGVPTSGFRLPRKCRNDGVVVWAGTAGRVVRELVMCAAVVATGADLGRVLACVRPFDRLRANGLGATLWRTWGECWLALGPSTGSGRTGSCRRFGVARGWAGRSRTAPTRGLWRAGLVAGGLLADAARRKAPSSGLRTGSGRAGWGLCFGGLGAIGDLAPL